MNYRKLTGEDISILGFGCMRLPVKDNGKIDVEKSEELFNYALNNGINYFDTAWPYHNGESEIVLGNYLSKIDRDKIKIADKLPSWLIKSEDDMEKYLNIQLEKLKTTYIDYYLVHSLNAENFENLKNNNIFSFLDKIIKDGRVRHVGFSFHDEIEVFKEIVDSYDWEFCQIQLNYLDEKHQAGLEGLKYASDKGIDVIVMEPLRGGALSNNIPKDIAEIWNNSSIKRGPAEWAFKYLWDKLEVKAVLSGMNLMEHLQNNIRYACESSPNMLTDDELNVIERVKNKYIERMKVDCTGCKYCVPCPFGVDIPQCFEAYNLKSMLGLDSYFHYDVHLEDEKKAYNCRKCGICETKCPQKIDIREKLEEVVSSFGK